MTRILLLAGTAEARDLAGRLAQMPGLSPIASLSGVTAAPETYPVPVRQGGFGGVAGLVAWLRAQECGALIDATHPYTTTMQVNAMAAADRLGLPHLRLLRPPWPARPGWVEVPNTAAAAHALPPGARVLLTTGRKELGPFLDRQDVCFLLRTIEAVADLPDHVLPVTDRPPFTLAAELALMRSHRVTHLVTKNAGGAGTAKLDAADNLRLTTIVIGRPVPIAAETAATVDEAVAWLRSNVAFAS